MATITPVRPRIAARVSHVTGRYGHHLLRLSLGMVLFWFGVIKFVPGLSAADGLAQRTIAALTGGVLHGDTARLCLAILETFIGVALLGGWFPRVAVAALLGHMAGTFAPLVLFPDEMWQHPFVPTMEGQFILKNVVLISAAVVLAGVVMRSRLGIFRTAYSEKAAPATYEL